MALLWVSLLMWQGDPLREALERHVRRLASDELQGRLPGTAGGALAAAYVAEAFREAGLAPAGRDGFYHDVDRAGPIRNVAGILKGRSPELVLLAAHHDARGVVDGRVQNGADDNASGVAVLIEVARSWKGKVPDRTLCFVSFDAEEKGLLGSREFVKSGLVDLGQIAAVVVMDLVGGRFLPWEDRRLYALGSECSPVLDDLLARTEEGAGLELRRLSMAALEPYPGMARSDYGPFRDRRIPFTFLSTGTPWYYHTEHDDPEVLDFPKLARVAEWVRRLVEAIAESPERPRWVPVEAKARSVAALLGSLKEILARADEFGLEAPVRADLEDHVRRLSGDPDLTSLQKAMMAILTVARSAKRP
jgi:hypothetical protein